MLANTSIVEACLRAVVEQFVRQQPRLHTNGPRSVHNADHARTVQQRVFGFEFFDV